MAHFTTSGADTYPAGIVAQVRFRTHYVDGHHYATGTNSWVNHGDFDNLKFTWTPQSATSTVMLEHFHPSVHTSTGGGWGYLALTEGGDRNAFGGGLSGYQDTHGHFKSGFSGKDGMYHSSYGRMVYQNDSTTAYELGVMVKWSTGAWYYAHSNSFAVVSATELLGDLTH